MEQALYLMVSSCLWPAGPHHSIERGHVFDQPPACNNVHPVYPSKRYRPERGDGYNNIEHPNIQLKFRHLLREAGRHCIEPAPFFDQPTVCNITQLRTVRVKWSHRARTGLHGLKDQEEKIQPENRPETQEPH
jgi:hypothetical protein